MKKLLILLIFLIAITDTKTYIGKEVIFETISNATIEELDNFIAIGSDVHVFDKNANTLTSGQFIIFIFNPIDLPLESVINGVSYVDYETVSGLDIGYSVIYNHGSNHDRIFAFKETQNGVIPVVMFTPLGELKPHYLKYVLDTLELNLGDPT